MLQLNRNQKRTTISLSSHSTAYKKKTKDPRKGKNAQHGHDGRPKNGHPSSCDCESCGGDFTVRTHLLLDMSGYSRLDSDHSKSRKSTFSSIFSFFRFGKKSSVSQMAREDYRNNMKQVKFRDNELDNTSHGPLEPVTIANLKQDCFMIPITRLRNFFPAGHPIPSGDASRLRMVETNEPDVRVMFHMIGSAMPFMPTLASPLVDLRVFQQEIIVKAFKSTVTVLNIGSALQGMVLLNLERGGEMGAAEFPYMIVWVIDGKKCDFKNTSRKVKQISLEMLDPSKTGFTCSSYIDSFEEVACLVRPPIEKVCRRASTPSTGYIISVFKVFEGDDGENFERKWLGWSGAKVLYCSMTNDEVGLRRIILHKSKAYKGLVTYVLLCDCANFLRHVDTAVRAVPQLRMRLCGDTGLYRPICTV